jgi:hypothetical protein
LSKTLNLGPTNMTQLGLAAGVGGIVAEHMGYVTPNGIFSDVLKGMFAEGFNVPGVESIARSGGGGSLISDGNGGSIMNPPGAATASALGVGPAGYIPVWAYT